MGLLITLLLVLVNLFISITANSPDTDSLTSIATWVLGCIIFVQGAVFEYGCILLFNHIMDTSKSHIGRKFLHRFDSFSVLMSIVAFVLFNTIYYKVYLLDCNLSH